MPAIGLRGGLSVRMSPNKLVVGLAAANGDAVAAANATTTAAAIATDAAAAVLHPAA
jgi:hypothetical protein